jgi:AcrR family transcriptional regulator
MTRATRPYTQGARAAKSAATRARILAAARDLMPDADQLQVDEIARRAGVSVPTLYSHFGSKGGLLAALIGQVEAQAGLFAGFGRVWQCHDGEAALRTMLAATLTFWEEAWIFVEFGLRVRRTDEELAARLDRIDASRLGHLVVISRRLRQEGRLKPRMSPAKAGRVAFALTTPYVYEALVVKGGLLANTARSIVVDAAVGAVIDADTNPVVTSVIDWVKLGLMPPEI